MTEQPSPQPPQDVRSDLGWAFDPGLPIYALIDPLLGDVIAVPGGDDAGAPDAQAVQAARQAAWNREVYAVPPHDVPAPDLPPDLPPSRWPYLIALSGTARCAVMQETVQMAQQEWAQSQQHGLAGTGQSAHVVGGWLQSAADPHQLAAHLAQMMKLRTAVPTAAKHLRLCDRRVLGLARHVLGDPTLLAQFGPITSWSYLGLGGHMCRLQRSAVPEAPGKAADLAADWAPHPSVAPVQWHRLSHAQHHALAQGQQLHPGLARAVGHRPEALSGHVEPYAQAYDVALHAADQVAQLAKLEPRLFRRPPDRSASIALSLLYPGWHQQLKVVAMLSASLSPAANTAQAPTLHNLCVEVSRVMEEPA